MSIASPYIDVKWDDSASPTMGWYLNGRYKLKHAHNFQLDLPYEDGRMNEATTRTWQQVVRDNCGRQNKRNFKVGDRVKVRTADSKEDRFATVLGKPYIDRDKWRRIDIQYDNHDYITPFWLDSMFTLRHYDEPEQHDLPLPRGKMHTEARVHRRPSNPQTYDNYRRNDRVFRKGDKVKAEFWDHIHHATVLDNRPRRGEHGRRTIKIRYDDGPKAHPDVAGKVVDFWMDSPTWLRFAHEPDRKEEQEELPFDQRDRGRMNTESTLPFRVFRKLRGSAA